MRAQISEDVVLNTAVPDEFDFALEERVQEAKKLLADDQVQDMRYNLVPSELTEAEFWRRLFYTLSIAESVRTPSRPTAFEAYEDFAGVTPRCDDSRAACTAFSLNPAARPSALAMDYTPRGTAVGAYDDDFATTPPRR